MGNLGCGCPGSMAKVIERNEPTTTAGAAAPSELRQWPVQLHLLSPRADYFRDAELLVCADCVAFAMGNMHHDLMRSKAIAIACPKLDDTTPYVEKLTRIIAENGTPKVTVAIMEVPCCKGMEMMVRQAIAASGRDVPLETVVIGIDGARRN